MQREQEGTLVRYKYKGRCLRTLAPAYGVFLVLTRAILLPTLVELLASSGSCQWEYEYEERLENVG
jgi:hypothetical protein